MSTGPQEPPPVAFVAGATGYTGQALIAELRGRNCTTIAHIRPTSPRLESLSDRFGALGAVVDSTPWDRGQMTAALASHGPALVFAALGTTRARTKREQAAGERVSGYAGVDYGLTRILMDGCLTLEKPPLFVYLSSIGVPRREPREGSYFHARYQVEAFLSQSALPHLIIRPSFISGADREEHRPMERLGVRVADGGLQLLGALGGRRAAARYGSLTSSELAKAMVSAALSTPRASALTLETDNLREWL